MNRPVLLWLAVGSVAFVALPWYALEESFFTFHWPALLGDPAGAPGLRQAAVHGRWWLWPLILPLGLAAFAGLLPRANRAAATALVLAGAGGLAYLAFEGLSIDHQGPRLALFAAVEGGQPGIGWGAVLLVLAFAAFLSHGLAARGIMRGDAFMIGAIALVMGLVVIFIFFPLGHVLVAAFQGEAGPSAGAFLARAVGSDIWRLDCVIGVNRCGIAWNSLFLATLSGVTCTSLGFAFALLVTRTSFPSKKAIRLLTVLPIVTPPFVVGLAIILLFGRSGTVTEWVSQLFDLPRSRWVYGLPGIWFSQTLAFTPMAFLVMIGVVEGVSPSMEEAARTLRANRLTTFRTVTLPLIRPGLANAFLLCFIESLADFGNPLVIGGGYEVLSTQIFFAIAGAQYDQGRAAVLGIILLSFTLTAFWAQRYWLGRKSYTTITGKGDSGGHGLLPRAVAWPVYAVTLPWAAMTLVIYGTILFGGFVEIWGRDHTLTWSHYIDAFGIILGEHGIVWAGGAWNSFWTTLWVSAAAAPLTAATGLLTAYILARRRFVGRNAFDFMTMLSFATPGTVIGLSYIMAFNVPPIEITGTALILIVSFISRNMPVGIRAGVAAMSQIDKSLDEASVTLGAGSFTTLRRVILPLLRPAIVAALVYSFVSAVTAVSAIIFLVSAEYQWATAYIIGRVENGQYGLAIAYCSALIVLMIAVVTLIQFAVGSRRIGRRDATAGVLS